MMHKVGQFLVAALVLATSAMLLLVVLGKLAPAFVDSNPAGNPAYEPELPKVRRVGPFEVDFDTPPAKVTRLPDPDYVPKFPELEKAPDFVGPPSWMRH